MQKNQKILEVVPERPSAKYLNPEYVKWGNFTIIRYGRRSLYYLNIEGHIKHSWGNNVTTRNRISYGGGIGLMKEEKREVDHHLSH
ncbi:hypothetical protein EVAR_27331_1 [Eumeta japonica]|uniref:Uncharacterized protein n=1 Tax=Eumeta variegata TaxID=151549 RepID=A0A4C1UDA4_EUMVA|nr:hypothetical protein EVAR_27331_1 [Eumeta japonica]